MTDTTSPATRVAGAREASGQVLYDRGRDRASRVLQRADTTMIYLLIACTAMPAFLLAMPFRYGVACLAVLGGLTLVAILVRLAWMNAPERLVGATFLGLGCIAGIAIPALWIRAGVAAGALAITGGLLYTAGALSYHRRRPDPLPSVFGYHEVFHAYVCAAATCQFVAVYLLATH
jgi:hemolysin III